MIFASDALCGGIGRTVLSRVPGVITRSSRESRTHCFRVSSRDLIAIPSDVRIVGDRQFKVGVDGPCGVTNAIAKMAIDPCRGKASIDGKVQRIIAPDRPVRAREPAFVHRGAELFGHRTLNGRDRR